MEEKGGVNTFANDGSFMEMFKKKMEEEKLRCSSAEGGQGSTTTATELRDQDKNLKTSKSTTENARSNELAGPETGHTESTSSAESNDGGLHRLSSQNVENKGTKKDSNEKQAGGNTADEQSTKEGDKPVVASAPAQKKYSLLSHVGKRRDGKVSLKTGAVKKQRKSEAQESKDQDAWSKYMAEVQKYKAHVCGDEDKSRPLVK